MPIYQVEIEETRSAIVHIEAANEEEAEEIAQNIGETLNDHDWDHLDEDILSIRPDTPESGTLVWRGGETGTFVAVD